MNSKLDASFFPPTLIRGFFLLLFLGVLLASLNLFGKLEMDDVVLHTVPKKDKGYFYEMSQALCGTSCCVRRRHSTIRHICAKQAGFAVYQPVRESIERMQRLQTLIIQMLTPLHQAEDWKTVLLRSSFFHEEPIQLITDPGAFSWPRRCPGISAWS